MNTADVVTEVLLSRYPVGQCSFVAHILLSSVSMNVTHSGGLIRESRRLDC